MKDQLDTCVHVNSSDEIMSPFGKVLAVDYYDGPTRCLVECRHCNRVFALEMIDWDDDQSARVFSSTPADHDLFDRLVESASHDEQPRWPVWLPSSPGFYRQADQALRELEKPTAAVVLRLANHVQLASRVLSELERELSNEAGWVTGTFRERTWLPTLLENR